MFLNNLKRSVLITMSVDGLLPPYGRQFFAKRVCSIKRVMCEQQVCTVVVWFNLQEGTKKQSDE